MGPPTGRAPAPNALAPKAILASILFNQAQVIANEIKSVVNGTAKGEIVESGVMEGVGTFVENKALMATIPSEARECLRLVQQSYAEGKMRIPPDRIMGRQNGAKDVDRRLSWPAEHIRA